MRRTRPGELEGARRGRSQERGGVSITVRVTAVKQITAVRTKIWQM